MCLWRGGLSARKAKSTASNHARHGGQGARPCRELGYRDVEFRLGEIECLPLERDFIDLVISNCVLNLVPDKARAFAEVFRVLRPGGRFCVSDIVASAPLPDKAAALYVGCVAGAEPEADYLAIVRAADFSTHPHRQVAAHRPSGRRADRNSHGG